MDAPARLRVSCLVMLQVKVTEGVSGHATDFLQRTATGPSCGSPYTYPTFVLSVAVVLLVVSC